MEGKIVESTLNTEGLIPETHDTIKDVILWLHEHPKETTTDYGHGVGMLGQAIYNVAGKSPEDQIAQLKNYAEALVKKYGEPIIEFMKPELREALGYTLKEK